MEDLFINIILMK